MSEKIETDRRDFLKLAGLGTVAGGAVVVSSVAPAAAEEASKETSGYRETDHVKAFYKSARF